jgi:AAA domain, putative AbiEii toxin, Type IV TA system
VIAGDNGCGKTSVLEAILLVLGRRDLLPADAAPSVEYFSARREPEALGESTAPQEAPSLREAHRIPDLKRRLRNSYYHSIQSSKGGQMPEGSPFVRLQRFVQRFLGDDHILDVLPTSNNPGADHEVIVRTGDLPADVTSIAMARAAAVSRKDIPLIVPIDRLSSGQVALLAFAGPLVFRDEPADVVVIDELEQHLHVQWQRHMMRALRDLSPESQFIVATRDVQWTTRTTASVHSPAVWPTVTRTRKLYAVISVRPETVVFA